MAAAILLRFTMPAMEMPELRLALRPAGRGVYAGTGQKLTMPGRWHIRVHVAPRGKPPLEVLLADLATLQQGHAGEARSVEAAIAPPGR